MNVARLFFLGWQRMFDNQGRSYFVNHQSKTTQWEDPRRMDSHVFDTPLPNGYEMRYTKDGQVYFYNRHTKTLTLQDPRIGSAVVTIDFFFDRSSHFVRLFSNRSIVMGPVQFINEVFHIKFDNFAICVRRIPAMDS